MAVGLVAPKKLLPIDGVSLASVESAIRYSDRDDLVLLKLDEGSNVAAVFTKNRYCAAPVTLCKKYMAKSATRALLINSGNANAGTGSRGLKNAKQSCSIVAAALEIEETQVLPFSTGVIGEQLPMDAMAKGINAAAECLTQDAWLSAAEAIMTTDTVAKAVSEQVEIDGELITFTGIAKGSGMICPNMATMLAYVATDAAVEPRLLQSLLSKASDASFNRITVDSDTSTNDAVVLIATGKATSPEITHAESDEANAFYSALERVLIALATSVIRDGEGATKFVKVMVTGGAFESDCESIAYSVAHSPLVKTALYASDPNWGRILMAIGKASVEQLDLERVDIDINDVALIHAGEPAQGYTEAAGKAVFSEDEIIIHINLNLADASYHVWTSDLSHDYVSINADYRS